MQRDRGSRTFLTDSGGNRSKPRIKRPVSRLEQVRANACLKSKPRANTLIGRIHQKFKECLAVRILIFTKNLISRTNVPGNVAVTPRKECVLANALVRSRYRGGPFFLPRCRRKPFAINALRPHPHPVPTCGAVHGPQGWRTPMQESRRPGRRRTSVRIQARVLAKRCFASLTPLEHLDLASLRLRVSHGRK